MRKYFIIIMIIAISFLSGCSSKREMSKNRFVSITNNYRLTAIDMSSVFKERKDVKSATVAESADLWQMEFYSFINSDAAKDMYGITYRKYLNGKSSSKYANEINKGRHDEFTLVTEDKYMHVCRVNKTLLYVSVPIEYKIDAEKVIRALKY